MVITEGFDIPRACILYQIRNSKSKQLDEQVIGRVRRNPCLTYFEKLDKNTQEIFSKAYVYGIKPIDNMGLKHVNVKLKGKELGNEIIKEFQPFKIIELKEVPLDSIDIADCIDESKTIYYNKSIFQAYKELSSADDKVKEKQIEYTTSYQKWFEFTANLEAVKEKVKSIAEDYDKYGDMITVQLREDIYSFFYYNEKNSERFKDWIWINHNNEEFSEYQFSFDSEAEKEWSIILDDITNECCKTIDIEGSKIYLFGKNFIENSNIKYDYYDMRKHTSYPDFIFKDKNNRIHIFEVKSVNKDNSINLDEKSYKEKAEKLKKAYAYASKKTGYFFYLPVKIGNDWKIWAYENGNELNTMNKNTFIQHMKN